MRPRLEGAIKRLFRDNERMNVNVIWLKEYGAEAAIVDASHAFKKLAMIEQQHSAA